MKLEEAIRSAVTYSSLPAAKQASLAILIQCVTISQRLGRHVVQRNALVLRVHIWHYARTRIDLCENK